MSEAACHTEPAPQPLDAIADSSWFQSSLDLRQGLLVAELPWPLQLSFDSFRPVVPALH
ncbi:hypothetical protein RQP53_20300 [Paucibacter sp. APW11]|uniref:Uncharacterized protein n=1 Tax=Roseateles aquae TaxID=3077235 RepID=A0ABU3PGA3_9BURK|nr:hypothetical protein [Paucibacter sp. APW11]MDT9001630.1 hypothetical protein [Paucibacter sp. APW11]